MSAFWKVVRKLLKSVKFVGSFPGGRWEWTWGPFRVDFGTILGACGCRKSERMQCRNSNEKSLKKSHAGHYETPRKGGGGGPLNNLHFTPGHHDKDPLNTL